MASNEADDTSSVECDPSPIFTPSTTINGTAIDMEELNITDAPSISSIPAPGNTYVIRSVATGEVITFQRGQLVLGPSNGYGIRWECSKIDGWMTFRDPASYMYLGYDKHAHLQCSADESLGRDFCMRHNPNGSYMLLALWFHGNGASPKLYPVGIDFENEVEKLRVITNWESDSIGWEFIKVESYET